MDKLEKVNATPVVTFDKQTLALIKETICPPGTTEKEFELFVYQAKRTGLDPLARQIYCMKIKGRLSIQATIDGFRLIAERTGEYRGQTKVEWCDENGVWTDVWLIKNKYPAAARVGVYRENFQEPLYAVADWESYAVKDYQGNISYNWKNRAPLMLGKVAEALALRKAFPQELSNIYSSEEMQSEIEHATVVEVVEVPKKKEYEVIHVMHDVEDAESIASLQEIFKSNPDLHKDKKFLELVRKCKQELLLIEKYLDNKDMVAIRSCQSSFILDSLYTDMTTSDLYKQFTIELQTALESAYTKRRRNLVKEDKGEESNI